MLVGVLGGELSLDNDSRGNFRFLGGATVSLIVGESVTDLKFKFNPVKCTRNFTQIPGRPTGGPSEE